MPDPITRRFGWIKDTPDPRDYKYVPTFKIVQLPPALSLVEKCPPVYNQGNLGSCTANAGGGALQFTESVQEPSAATTPSRLFIYYNTRLIEGSVYFDSGGTLRDTFKTLANQGACPETEWPYNIDVFAEKPTDVCYVDALKTKAIVYYSVNQNLNDLKTCLFEGFPFTVGIQVFDNFPMGLGNPNIPTPLLDSQIQGGHAVLICGYNDSTKMFTLRNSWGNLWGNEGYGYIPYKYLLDPNLAGDFWTIRKLTLENTPIAPISATTNPGCSAWLAKMFGAGK